MKQKIKYGGLYHNNMSMRKIIDTKHMIDRFSERYDRFNNKSGIEKSINNIINTAMEYIITKYHDQSNTRYVIHSKCNGYGIVIAWEHFCDPDLDDGCNHAIIITILPIAPKHSARCDEILINI